MNEPFDRDLIRGSLDLMVLSVLSQQPQYGYMIQQKISQASDGRVPIQAGTLYPLLHKLESEKLIRAKWDDSSGRKRKWYELTAKGRKRLRSGAEQWQQFANCVLGLLNPKKNLPGTSEA